VKLRLINQKKYLKARKDAAYLKQRFFVFALELTKQKLNVNHTRPKHNARASCAKRTGMLDNRLLLLESRMLVLVLVFFFVFFFF
jgi:hypothetical protein